jgi:hypothetical protein
MLPHTLTMLSQVPSVLFPVLKLISVLYLPGIATMSTAMPGISPASCRRRCGIVIPPLLLIRRV